MLIISNGGWSCGSRNKLGKEIVQVFLLVFFHFASPLPFARPRDETVGGRTWSRVIFLLLDEDTLCFIIQTYTNNINKSYKETSQNIYLHWTSSKASGWWLFKWFLRLVLIRLLRVTLQCLQIDPSLVFLVVGLVTVAWSKWSWTAEFRVRTLAGTLVAVPDM